MPGNYEAKDGGVLIDDVSPGGAAEKAGLKAQDIIVHPRCRNVIDELSTYSYEIDKQTDEVLPKLADKKNHTIDALRYALEGVRRAPAVPLFGTYGQR